jgi:hypothetical protein
MQATSKNKNRQSILGSCWFLGWCNFEPEDGGGTFERSPINVYMSTWRHITQASTLHVHSCDYFRSCSHDVYVDYQSCTNVIDAPSPKNRKQEWTLLILMSSGYSLIYKKINV